MPDSSISLNKFISSTGICSRREADQWIAAGRVKINGKTAKKGNRVSSADKVSVDDELIGKRPKPVYIAFNKPAGVTCTTDLKDKSNIIDYINFPKRIFPIGRLDKPSTGLILLTNDGDIVNEILREEHGHEKEYIVSVNKAISPEFIQRMRAGIPILDTVTKKCTVEKIGRQRFRIILTQGLNRQIRKMCEHLNYEVVTLHRMRIMHIELGRLPEGSYRKLTKLELELLGL